MLKRLIKFSIYLALQFVLLTSVAATAQDTDKFFEIADLTDNTHSASGVINIEGDAQIEDVQTCISAVHETLQALPQEHADALNDITLIFDSEAKRGQAGGNIMRLRCVDITEQELVAVMVHEMGHVVDTGLLQGVASSELEFTDGSKPVLADDLSAEFYEISWVNNYLWTDGTSGYSFVSRYAAKDPFEDFAETYLMYVLHGESFRAMASENEALAAKYEFMKELFDGTEYYGIDLNSPDLSERSYDATLFDYDLETFWINNKFSLAENR